MGPQIVFFPFFFDYDFDHFWGSTFGAKIGTPVVPPIICFFWFFFVFSLILIILGGRPDLAPSSEAPWTRVGYFRSPPKPRLLRRRSLVRALLRRARNRAWVIFSETFDPVK